MLSAVILAGGLGTRLKSDSHPLPKVLADVNGRPFLHFLLEMLATKGFESIVLCVGYLGNQVVEFVGDGSQYGLWTKCVFDSSEFGTELVGTAGAVRGVLPLLGSSFWVINGDTYLNIDYTLVEKHYHNSIYSDVMVTMRNRGYTYQSNVMLRGNRVVVYDKDTPLPSMAYVDAGVAILSADTIRKNPTVDQLHDLYRLLSIQGKLGGYPVTQRFYEINTAESLEAASQFLLVSHHASSAYPAGRSVDSTPGAERQSV